MTIKSNVTVPDYSGRQISFQLPILNDAAPKGKNFGAVKTYVQSSYAVVSLLEKWTSIYRNR